MIKSNGNGGFVISNKGLILLISIITLLSVFANVIINSTFVKAEVNYNSENIADMNIQQKVNTATIIKVETRLENMQEDLSEIKNIVRDIQSQGHG